MSRFADQKLVANIIDAKAQLAVYNQISHTFAENVTDDPSQENIDALVAIAKMTILKEREVAELQIEVDAS